MVESVRHSNIDIARGLAMLIVIEWHTLDFHSPYTDGWVMPLFFVIMGVFYKQPDSLRELLRKKVRNLIVPYLFFSVPSLIILIINQPYVEVLKKIVDPYSNIHGVSWFIICTFVCYIICFYIHRYIKKKALFVVVYLIISVIGYTMGHTHIMGYRLVLPFYVSTSMTVMGFIALGIIMRDKLLLSNNISKILLMVSCALYIIGVKFIPPSANSYIWNNYDDSYFSLIFNGFVGSIFIINICHYLPFKISFLGKYSLLLLLIHPYVISLLCNYTSGYLLYISVLALTIVFTWFCSRYIPFFCGLKK